MGTQRQKPPFGSVINWACGTSNSLGGCWLLNEGAGRRCLNLAAPQSYTTFDSATNTENWGKWLYGYNLGNSDFNANGVTVQNSQSVWKQGGLWTVVSYGLPSFGGTAEYKMIQKGGKGCRFNNASGTIYMRYNNGTTSYDSSAITIPSQYKIYVWRKSSTTNIDYFVGKTSYGSSTTGTDSDNTSNIQWWYQYAGTMGRHAAIFIWNRSLSDSELFRLNENPYFFIRQPRNISIFSVSQAGSTTFNASVQNIISSLPSPSVQVSSNVTVVVSPVTAIFTQPTPTVSTSSNVTVSASAQIVSTSLQSPTVSTSANVTVSVSALTASFTMPSVTLSGSSTKTVNVACLTMTASIQTSVQKGTILPNSLATAMALITATEKVTLSPSSFSLIAVLNSVTFGGIQNRTILASALTANFTLFEPIVSQRYRSFLLHTKHNQPRYVNKVNAQRRIAKKNTVSGV